MRPALAVTASAVLLFSMGASAWAAQVRIKSMRAPVFVKKAKAKDNKWYVAKAGAQLDAGDSVKTGDRGEANLLMQDGTKMVLRSKSQMTIKEIAPSRVMSLEFGRLKSVVKKLKTNNKFEVKTPIAAASVRGTVFEVGFDEEKKSGFLDVTQGLVALEQEAKEIMVPAGQRVDFLSGQPLGDPVPKQSKEDSDTQAEVRQEVGLGMSKEEVMAAAAAEMRFAEYQEGKTLVDVFGKRVRLEEYIIRKPKEVALADQDKAFKLVVLNERDERFDYFYYRGVFNTTLPEDLSLALNDVRGKLGATQPTYFLTAYEQAQSNTQDSVKDNASGGHLVKISFDGTNYTLNDPTGLASNKTVVMDETSVVDGVTYHKIYDPVSDKFQTVTHDQYLAGDYRPTVYDASNDTYKLFSSGDTFWGTRYNTYSHMLNSVSKQSYVKKTTVNNVLALDLDAEFTFAGGYLIALTETPSGADMLHNRVTLYYGDATTETVDTYIIDDEGKIAPTSAFANVTTGQAFKNELLKWNYEQVTTSTEFQGRKIDLVVEPKILIKSGLIK
jgi:hypothetical protein